MNPRSALTRALGELAALATTQQDRERLAALADRVAFTRLRVLVAGGTKRGKSTLVNALIGRALLPAGLTPLTSVATTVRHGDDPHAQVRFLDGHEEKQPLSALRTLVTEPGNSGNRRGVADVTVHVNAPLLARGVELVDTPGTGSVFEPGTEAARAAMESADAAVLVLGPDPPMSASEQDLLHAVAECSARTFVVLNKADRLSPEELSEVTGFTRSVLTRSAGIPDRATGVPGRVYALSSLAALSGGDPGFAAFAADFTGYLEDRRSSDLRRSAIRQARQAAISQLDQIAVARRGAQAAASDVADRVERFRALLTEAIVEPREAVTAVSSGSARLLFALNDSADEIAASLVASLIARLDAALVSELPRARATDVERRGRDWLAAAAAEAVTSWYEHQKAGIEEGVAALDARLTADLRQELGVLRGSATELPGLDVVLPEPGTLLPEPGSLPSEPGTPLPEPGGLLPEPSGLLPDHGGLLPEPGGLLRDVTLTPAALPRDRAAAVPAMPTSGRLPGGLGRSRARDRLCREIANSVQSQVDAAREDLRRRLAETTDTLVVAVRQSFADAAGQVQAVLHTATELGTAAASEAQRAEAELTGREAAVRQVLSLLDRAEAAP